MNADLPETKLVLLSLLYKKIYDFVFTSPYVFATTSSHAYMLLSEHILLAILAKKNYFEYPAFTQFWRKSIFISLAIATSLYHYSLPHLTPSIWNHGEVEHLGDSVG